VVARTKGLIAVQSWNLPAGTEENYQKPQYPNFVLQHHSKEVGGVPQNLWYPPTSLHGLNPRRPQYEFLPP